MLLRFWYWWYIVLVDHHEFHNGIMHCRVVNRWQQFRWHHRWRIKARILKLIPHPVFIWFFLYNPFQKYEMRIDYFWDGESHDEEIEKATGLHICASGCDFYNRDCECLGSRRQIKHAIIAIDNLAKQYPEWNLSQINEIEDHEYMGVGY